MRPLLFLPAIALAGCAQTPASYPSLLPRAIEDQSLAEPERPEPVVAPDPALDARIAALVAQADAAGARFAAAAQDAEAKIAVARGLAPGSEAWLTAQAALSALAEHRSATIAALAGLEELAIARGVEGLPAYPALRTAIDAVAARSGEQEQRVTALEAALAGG